MSAGGESHGHLTQDKAVELAQGELLDIVVTALNGTVLRLVQEHHLEKMQTLKTGRSGDGVGAMWFDFARMNSTVDSAPLVKVVYRCQLNNHSWAALYCAQGELSKNSHLAGLKIWTASGQIFMSKDFELPGMRANFDVQVKASPQTQGFGWAFVRAEKDIGPAVLHFLKLDVLPRWLEQGHSRHPHAITQTGSLKITSMNTEDEGAAFEARFTWGLITPNYNALTACASSAQNMQVPLRTALATISAFLTSHMGPNTISTFRHLVDEQEQVDCTMKQEAGGVNIEVANLRLPIQKQERVAFETFNITIICYGEWR